MGFVEGFLKALSKWGIIFRPVSWSRRYFPALYWSWVIKQVSHLHIDSSYSIKHFDPQHKQERYVKVLRAGIGINSLNHQVIAWLVGQELYVRDECVFVQLLDCDFGEEFVERGGYDKIVRRDGEDETGYWDRGGKRDVDAAGGFKLTVQALREVRWIVFMGE